jgi:hypothetical protein
VLKIIRVCRFVGNRCKLQATSWTAKMRWFVLLNLNLRLKLLFVGAMCIHLTSIEGQITGNYCGVSLRGYAAGFKLQFGLQK